MLEGREDMASLSQILYSRTWYICMNDDFKHQYWSTMSDGTTYNVTHVANHPGKLVIQKLLRFVTPPLNKHTVAASRMAKRRSFFTRLAKGGKGAEIAFPTKRFPTNAPLCSMDKGKEKTAGKARGGRQCN